MEAVLVKYDFANATDDMLGDLQEDLDNVNEVASTMTVDGMRKFISTFVQKTCVQPFPGIGGPAYWMCRNVHDYIVDVLDKCESEYKNLTKEQGQGLLFDLMLDYISKGHGSTHYDVISYMATSFKMDDFIEETRSKEHKRLLDAIKQLKFVQEKETDVEDIGSAYKSGLGYVIQTALRSTKKMKEQEIRDDFCDMYLFYLMAITKNPEGMAEGGLVYVHDLIRNKYKRDPIYRGCKDVELFKRHLKAVKNLLQDKNFPRFEKELKAFMTHLGELLDGIDCNEDIAAKVMVELKEFVSVLKTNVQAEKFTSAVEKFEKIQGNINETISKLQEMEKEIQDKAQALEAEVQFKEATFETWAPTFIKMLNTETDIATVEAKVQKELEAMVEKTKPTKEQDKYWIQILCGLLKFPTKDMSNKAKYLMKTDKLKRIWSWKKNIEGAKKVLVTITDLTLQHGNIKKRDDEISNYGDLLNELFEQLELVKISDQVMKELANLLISVLEKKSIGLNYITVHIIDNLNFKKNQDLIPDYLRRFSVLYFDQDYPWEDGWTKRACRYSFEKILAAYTNGGEMPREVNEIFIKMLNYAMAEDTDRIDFENRSPNIYGEIIWMSLRTFVSLHCEGPTPEVLKPLLPALHRMMEDDDEDMKGYASSAMSTISDSAPKLLAVDKDFDRLIQKYVENPGDYRLLSSISGLYKHNTKVMAKRFQDIFGTIGKDKDTLNNLFYLMMTIAENQPELFTRANINTLSRYLDDKTYQTEILMTFDRLHEKNPDSLIDQVDVIINHKNLDVSGTHFMQNVLASVTVKHKKYLKPVLKFFMDWSKNEKRTEVSPIFYGMRKLADHFGPEPFKPYRKYLDSLTKSTNSFTKDMVNNLIDVLEGRSLATVHTDVKQVQEDVDELDERVTGTEIVVGGVVTQVERHEGEITDVKEGVANVNKRVDVVEEDLEEVKEKVEEIDMKTMSNAPTWSRDLTKLMNPKSDHDWRLLASRLGYSNDDIRAWSTQSDPCMALLSEWYATHKTIEATQGVLNILQEMNRLDAAVIVENAMKKAEDVVEDEEFEYPSPPPVFLSYQWGHQNEVKLLKQHLEMAGYLCWMDVGQMGGGDKLFEKIDAGIRGAKVMICCVSEKYAKSPNCNREVNLAVNLRKPMIPLQMEKIAWPPVGSMGPIFSEYLYIRFYSGGKGGKYWAEEKFQEILMQLQFNGLVPDEKLITKEYKNWWLPVAEEIIIPQKDDKSKGKTEKKDKTSAPDEADKEKSPEVFLSYQWGKQKQIQGLYKKLTGLGLKCWMDIHQMGGGDSLYDKIDRGVRGCKVVVSSVTQKYALSANCRREVSLADALKKPIIPLLLEEITWPPTGPMAMVFTQLLYINFCKNPDIQMSWKGKEFDELMQKLKGHIPELLQNEVDTTRKGKPSQSATSGENTQKLTAGKPDRADNSASKAEEQKSSTDDYKSPETQGKSSGTGKPQSQGETASRKPAERKSVNLKADEGDKGKVGVSAQNTRTNKSMPANEPTTTKGQGQGQGNKPGVKAENTARKPPERKSESLRADDRQSKVANRSEPAKESTSETKREMHHDNQQTNAQPKQKTSGDGNQSSSQGQNATPPVNKSSSCSIL